MNAPKQNNAPIAEDIAKDIDDDMQVSDLFEGGHKLSALENIGTSLTTLWSNCAINGIPSRENLDNHDVKKKTNNAAKQNGLGAVTFLPFNAI